MPESTVMSIIFDGAALPLLVLEAVAMRYRKTTKGLTNFFFLLTIFSTMITCGVEMGEAFVRLDGLNNTAELNADYTLNAFYFPLMYITLYSYFLFLLSYFRYENFFRKPLFWVISSLPLLITIVLIGTNSATNAIFTVTAEDGYQRGPYLFLLYIFSLFYFISGLLLILKTRKFVTLPKWLTFLNVYTFILISVIVQLLNPWLIIELWMLSLAYAVLSFFVLRPETLTDTLTGIPSYSSFKEELGKMLKTKRRFQVVYLKLEGITTFRSRFGEEAYLDQIRSVYNYIRTAFHSPRHIGVDVYFEGPGFFQIILDTPTFDASLALMKMEEALAKPKIPQHNPFGLAPFRALIVRVPEETSDVEELLRLGDRYERFTGKSQIFTYAWDVLSNRDYQLSLELPKILSEAIEKDSFDIYYQPIYDVKSGRYTSAEALCRLHTRKYGFLSPGLFIPAAERLGLMIPLGKLILEHTFKFVGSHDFKALGLDYLEINLSVQQFLSLNLPSQIKALQEKYHVDPKKINFEITESVSSQNATAIERNMRSLEQMGYSFSLDDYGTGYSNIRRVATLPLSIIKIDKSMVDNFDSREGQILMKNTIKTMKDVNKKVLVEGVETKDKAEALSALGVDLIQGFYFSKPRPEHDFMDFLTVRNQALKGGA